MTKGVAKKKTTKELIRSAKLPERSVPTCLQADLVAEHESVERKLKEAKDHRARRLDSGSDAQALSARLVELEAEMAEHTIEFRLRAMPRKQWKRLIAAHPPRKAEDGTVEERDKYIGVNVDSFFTALVRASVVEPQLDAEDWRVLLGDDEQDDGQQDEDAAETPEDGVLTDRQFDQLADAAWELNRADVDVPFSRAALRTQTSEPE